MVASDFLNDPDMRRWLGGVEPAWTLLTLDSLRALRDEPIADHTAIRIAADLSADEVSGSAVARNAIILLKQATERGGLALTATGNLSRAVVAEMRELIDWPAYDQAVALQFDKVVNEPDFAPLYIVRNLAQAAGLVRRQRGKLLATRLGKSMLDDTRQGSLLAILFHIAFWRIDHSYFGRGLFGSWPQNHVGVVLWSLSVSANSWQASERLTRLCSIPEPAMLTEDRDLSHFAVEARILRPLLWFGLLEHRAEREQEARPTERHSYRKAALFDRLLSFDVEIDRPARTSH
jgi:hypothetical protein